MSIDLRATQPASDEPILAIVGAGIGGLAAAQALRSVGFAPVVYERATELKEIGAGILLSPNGVRALEHLGIRAEVERHSRVIREWQILNPRGRRLQRMRPIRDGLPAYSLHRADLQAVLAARMPPGTLRLGYEFSHFEPTASESLRLQFRSDANVKAQALIGADGLRSAVRAARWGKEPPRYSGYVGWRGVAPWIPPEYAGEHLSESWGEGKRFGISPMGHGRCYWYASANRPEGAGTHSESTRETVLKLFRHWHGPIADLIESTPESCLLTNAIYDRPPRHPWSEGPVTLLGDAAHPTTPNLGQGACCALEDACVLAECMRRSSSFTDAFTEYEKIRSARADAIQRASWWLGQAIQLESVFSTRTRDLSMLLTPDFLADFSMRWLFRFSP